MFARKLDTGVAGEVHGDRPSLGLEHELMVKFVEMKLALDVGLCIFD